MKHQRLLGQGLILFVSAATLAACGGGPIGSPPGPVSTTTPVTTASPATTATPVTGSTATPAPVSTATASPIPDSSRLPSTPAPVSSATATPVGTPTPLSTATPVIPAGVKIYLVNHTKNGTTGETPSVTVFSATASGNVAPVETISGANTGLDFPQYIGLDTAGNMYVTNQAANLAGSLREYAAGANGNVTPIASITGLDTPEGIALDAAGDMYVAQVQSLNEYAPGTTGANPAPMRSIGAPANAMANATGIAGPYGIKLDATGNIYVAQEEAIDVFGPTQSGNVAPNQSVTGTTALFASDLDVAVDSSGNIYCVNYNLNTINEYSAGTTGTMATPSNVITSPNLDEPTGIAIDKSGNLYVANYGNNSIVIIPSGTTGAAVGTVISGAATGISSPYGIAVQ